MPQIHPPNGKIPGGAGREEDLIHKPEFWEIMPPVDMLGAMQTEEYRREHLERYGEIRSEKAHPLDARGV